MDVRKGFIDRFGRYVYRGETVVYNLSGKLALGIVQEVTPNHVKVLKTSPKSAKYDTEPQIGHISQVRNFNSIVNARGLV